MELPVTAAQMNAWRNGQLIQIAMPHLTPSQREFIMTGITSEEWDEAFKDDEGDFESVRFDPLQGEQ